MSRAAATIDHAEISEWLPHDRAYFCSLLVARSWRTWFTIGSTPEFSANRHLVERFTRVDADTLLYEFTIREPRTFTRPVTVQFPMRRSQDRIYEYACHEGNYSVYNILAGTRGKENAAEQPRRK